MELFAPPLVCFFPTWIGRQQQILRYWPDMANMLRARLGPLVSKVQQTVAPVYKSTESVVTKQYENIMKGGEQYVVKDPAEADKLLKQWFYTNMSRLAICHYACRCLAMCHIRCPSYLGRETCRIPAGVKQMEKEWGSVQDKLGKRHEMPLTEVQPASTVWGCRHPSQGFYNLL